jgi:hypothetical protein
MLHQMAYEETARWTVHCPHSLGKRRRSETESRMRQIGAPRKASRDIASACGGLSEGLNGARGTMPSPRRKIMRQGVSP